LPETEAAAGDPAAGVKRGGRPSEGLLYTLLAVMVGFWSLNFIVGKVALREFPPLLLAGLRTAVAGALVWPLYLWHALRRPRAAGRPRWKRADVPFLLFLGLFGVALNQFFFILGLSRTSVAHASILIGTTPILVLLIAAGLRLERITAAKALGMLIALGGLVVLNSARSSVVRTTVLGDVLVFLGALAFAVFTAFGKRASGRHDSVTVSTFAYVGGATMLGPFTVWQSIGFPYRSVSLAGWASLFYMAAFSSVLCYLIFYYALTFIPASRVSAFSYLQPPMATLLAIPLLGEPVTLPLVAGGALVFAGVLVTERG
jgi:drug/metabolite transporter (DMT)-like permease